MALLLWTRFVVLAALAALIAGCVWTGLSNHEE